MLRWFYFIYDHMSKVVNIKKIIGVDTYIPDDLKKRILEKLIEKSSIIKWTFNIDERIIKYIKKNY